MLPDCFGAELWIPEVRRFRTRAFLALLIVMVSLVVAVSMGWI